MVNPFSVPILISSILLFIFGGFLLYKNLNSNQNSQFGLLSLTTGLWFFSYVFMYNTSSPYNAHVFAKLGYTGIIMIPTFLFGFTAEFAESKTLRDIFPVTVLIGFSFMMLNYYNLFIVDVYRYYWGFYPKGSIFLIIFIFYFCTVFLVALKVFYGLNRKKIISSNRARYLLLAFLLAICGCVDYPGNFGYEIYPLGYLFATSCISVVFYAIVRHRLMDIDVIIRKGLLYTATTTVVTGLYIIAIYTSNFLFNRIPGFNVLWFMLPAIFILALLFQPIKNQLQEFLDRNFFRTKYESDKIAHKFSDGVKKLMKTKELAEYISRSAMQTFKLFGAASFVFDEERMIYVCEDARGTLAELKGSQAAGDLEIIRQMKSTGHMIIAEELVFTADKTRRVKKGDISDLSSIQTMVEELAGLKCAIAVPSISKKKEYRLIAFLAADRKKSEDAFSGSDIDLLENLAGQVSISIENAMLYKDQLKTIERSMSLEKLADLGRATAGVAGEAQSALSYIEWFSNQLPEKKNDPEFLLSQSRVLFSETEKMKLLMQGVLEYSRPSPMKIENIPLKRTAEDIMALMQEPAGKQGISIGLSCPDGLEVSADKNGLKQILLNLLMNAVEAAGQGGKVEIKALEEGGRTMIYVSDTGPGIPPQVRQRMFEPFYTTKEHGIGLGLSIVDQAVRALGGAVTFDSGPGGGTTVKVELKR